MYTSTLFSCHEAVVDTIYHILFEPITEGASLGVNVAAVTIVIQIEVLENIPIIPFSIQRSVCTIEAIFLVISLVM